MNWITQCRLNQPKHLLQELLLLEPRKDFGTETPTSSAEANSLYPLSPLGALSKRVIFCLFSNVTPKIVSFDSISIGGIHAWRLSYFVHHRLHSLAWLTAPTKTHIPLACQRGTKELTFPEWTNIYLRNPHSHCKLRYKLTSAGRTGTEMKQCPGK